MQLLYNCKFVNVWFSVPQTSVIKRYVDDVFSANYKLTIGVDFSLKKVQWSDSTLFQVQLWDVAGHERFAHLARVYYKSAIAAIIIFDLTRKATFESASKWANDVREKVTLSNGEPIPLLLLANKCDQLDVEVDDSLIEEYATSQKFIGWFKTSAKDSTNIDEAMTFLIGKISELQPEKSDQKAFTLGTGEVHQDNDGDSDEESKVELKNAEDSTSCCFR